MSEIVVENMDNSAASEPPPAGPPAPETSEPPPEEPAPAEEPATVSFATSSGEVSFEAAPKRRGRPKGAAKPKAEPKRRGRPPRSEVAAQPIEEPPPEPVADGYGFDPHAFLEPLVQAYMASSHLRAEQQKQQRYRDLFQNMMGGWR